MYHFKNFNQIQPMNISFDHVIRKEQALQSNVFRDEYQKYLDDSSLYSFTTFQFDDIQGMLDSILLKCKTLTSFQKDTLNKLFIQFDNIRQSIDPNRLKKFDFHFNNEDELLLYRNTENGLTNIIIDNEDLISYSFIPKKDENSNSRTLLFYDAEGDFESLAYKFFANN